MSHATMRSAYGIWPQYNQRLREVVATMTDQQLAIRPSPERWPIWATVGRAACQRVFWLCDFAGEPGAETTPFTNAAHTPIAVSAAFGTRKHRVLPKQAIQRKTSAGGRS